MLQGLHNNTPHLLKHNPNFTANNDTKYQTRAGEINREKRN